MKKKIIHKIAAGLLVLTMLCASCLLAACGGGITAASVQFLTPLTFTYQPERAVPVEDSFKTALADFSLNLLRDSRAGGDGTMVSGLSVLTALAMVANGADGETLAQMLDVMGICDVETLNAQIYAYYAGLKSTENAKFTYANAVWVTNQNWFTVSDDFLAVIGDNYNAQVASADFTDKDTVKAINNWCKKQTDGMIPNIVNDSTFNKDTVMALLNALCFDGKWQTEYEKSDIWDAPFHGTNGDTTVSMLHSDEDIYLEGQNETGFVKYYKDWNYAFVGLLPSAEGDIADYLATLDGETFVNLLKNADGSVGVNVTMPEFKQDFEVSLNDILAAMGMPDAFDPYSADFTRLGTLANPNENITISKVIHKTHIEVDRAGTKAAAVTLISMEKNATCGPEEPKVVILDRPFVYAIIDTATNTPLFIGTVENVSGK